MLRVLFDSVPTGTIESTDLKQRYFCLDVTFHFAAADCLLAQ